MRNLLCVIGRHDWQVKHDKEGQPYEICGRPRVITFEVATLGRAGRIGTKTVTHSCPLNHPIRVPASPAGEVGALSSLPRALVA
jgi:hypothetical protein